ncbi:hypothetical protein JX265_009641 [Neoarthrinium moseri]|uniref:Sin3-associated polypeptide Sap18 n=1 Tax=Neoarthrinium moseri TaxID=1658444 RepID=A0A9Q0AKZ1_9PEZI|nr:uncharacterized protein JN550_010877 [Neoarthrinium moseri]KAI1844096.1 hypothetical protein JX266_009769 [Neoarthrinium moseri]KAI1861022.1 hypothetical protein JX265_009641 [Neoarthrinium moseri]KAI1861347.1 hypothetical protein JN550_010877 [Neoarthrinium moseri]
MDQDGRSSPPFALRLFYRTGAFHRPDEFASPTLPPHLTIHTWPSCTLAELSHHLAFAPTSILPDPAVGTRLSFRLIFADTRAANSQHHHRQGGAAAVPARFMVKDLGSVVIGDGGPGLDPADAAAAKSLSPEDDGAKTLADARLVVGDYISVAILPPLGDGSVAPASAARMGRGSGVGEAGSVVGRAPGYGRDRERERDREDGFGGGRRGGRGGRHDGYGRGGSEPVGEWRRGDFSGRGGRGIPVGEWRRGEALPDAPFGRGRGRGRY